MMEDTNIVAELGRLVFGVLALVLGTLVTYYVPRVARAIERRLGGDIPDAHVAAAERLALDAIAYAEERGRALALKKGVKLLSSAKLDLAADYFRDHASAKIIAAVGSDVSDWLEAKLGMLRPSRY